MRLMFSLSVLLLFVVGATAEDEKKHTSKDGRFAVQFPAGEKVMTVYSEPAKTGITSVSHMGVSYIVTYIDFPIPAKEIKPQVVLDGAVKNVGEDGKSKLIELKKIEFGTDKLPGRDLLVEREGHKVRIKIILVEKRLYLVAVGGKKDFATTKEASSFIDSFELTK